LVGYSYTRRAYRILLEGSGSVIESRDVIFNEEDTTFAQHATPADDWCFTARLPPLHNIPADHLLTCAAPPTEVQPAYHPPHQHNTRLQATAREAAAAARSVLPPLKQKQKLPVHQHQDNTRSRTAQHGGPASATAPAPAQTFTPATAHAPASVAAHSVHVIPNTYKQWHHQREISGHRQ